MARTVQPLSRKQKEAAYLLGYGKTAREVAEQLSIDPQAITRWRKREDFAALEVETANKYAQQLLAKTMLLMDKQIEQGLKDGAKIDAGWLSQGAGGKVMQHVTAMLDKERSASVSFTFNVPEPGMPDTEDAKDEADGGP